MIRNCIAASFCIFEQITIWLAIWFRTVKWMETKLALLIESIE